MVTFPALRWAVPALGALAACTLTTSVDGLQTPGSGMQGGATPQGGSHQDAAPDTEAVDESTVIAADQRGLRGIAFHKSLYWVDTDTPAIWMSGTNGDGAKPVLTAAQNVDAPFDVDASDNFIFWTEFTWGTVWRAEGTTISSLGGNLPRAAFVTLIDGDTPLVSDLQGDQNGQTVWRNGTRLYARLETVMGIGHEGKNIYWAQPKAIYRGATDGREAVKIATAANATGGVATNGVDVIWVENERELWRQPLAAPETKRRMFLAGPGQRIFDVAVSSSYVFWTDPGTRTVRRLAL